MSPGEEVADECELVEAVVEWSGVGRVCRADAKELISRPSMGVRVR